MSNKSGFTLIRFKDPRIEGMVNKTEKRILAAWAIDCTERVMPYFEKEHPEDKRPRMAINALKDWMRTGVFSMAAIRKASLDSHAAAREVGQDDAARSAARSAGQAVATAHVKAHSLAAALYSLQAVYRASDPDKAEAAVEREQGWQLNRLLELRKRPEVSGRIHNQKK